MERVLGEEWHRKLTTTDPLDPTMLAVAEGWVALSQPKESQKESEARGQIKLAEEAVAQPMGDISVLTDPERCLTALGHIGRLLPRTASAACDRAVYLKKAPHSGDRFKSTRAHHCLVIVP
ncbi:hypothetical protein GCM10018790_46200 [Kitasatospora xanthocidica]|nr:hypothetical protein GCM10018790_46200 [Kitasatospora xanthocidica]